MNIEVQNCKKCGSDYYRLRYFTEGTFLSNVIYPQYDDPFNLVKHNVLISEALQVKCNRCGYSYFTKTLENDDK